MQNSHAWFAPNALNILVSVKHRCFPQQSCGLCVPHPCLYKLLPKLKAETARPVRLSDIFPQGFRKTDRMIERLLAAPSSKREQQNRNELGTKIKYLTHSSESMRSMKIFAQTQLGDKPGYNDPKERVACR